MLAAIVLAISVPASGWIARAPQSLSALQQKLAFLRGPIEAVQSGMARLQSVMGGPPGQAHMAVGGGNTLLTLTDGTRITLVGVAAHDTAALFG